jgi:hypothetical protein
MVHIASQVPTAGGMKDRRRDLYQPIQLQRNARNNMVLVGQNFRRIDQSSQSFIFHKTISSIATVQSLSDIGIGVEPITIAE